MTDSIIIHRPNFNTDHISFANTPQIRQQLALVESKMRAYNAAWIAYQNWEAALSTSVEDLRELVCPIPLDELHKIFSQDEINRIKELLNV